jgi:hypothetical protein
LRTSALRHDQDDVVVLLVTTEAPDFIDNGSNYGFGRSFTILPQRFDQTLLSNSSSASSKA